MKPKIFRVILPVSDVDLAAKFYAALLGFPGRRVSPGRHYFDCDGTILACYDPRADGDGSESKPNPDHIYFAVDDLESVFQAVQPAGGSLSSSTEAGVMGEIAERPWGERSFYATDPFGNKVCFVERPTMFTGE